MSNARNEFIQALRFVAAALVLVTHATFYYQERIDSSMPIWHGEVGVPIFFVISGIVMVIASSRLDLNATGAREFIVRRLLRIVPLYWLVTLAKIVVALAVPSVVHHNHFELVYAIKSLFFIPAYNAAGEVRPIHGVGWTLLHEMFFYLAFAAMMALRTRPVPGTSLLIVGLFGAGLVMPPQGPIMFVVTHAINLNFVVGMLIGSAILHLGRGGSSRWPFALAITLPAVAAFSFVGPDWAAAIPLDPVVLVLGCTMLALASWKTPAALDGPVALGSSSYALYLFHPLLVPPALLFIHKFASGLGAWTEIMLTSILAVAVAHAIYLLIELPLNSWVKRVASQSVRRLRAIRVKT